MAFEEGGGSDIEILDPENFRNPEENIFNHQSLVMIAMKKCLELGSKELREGWWEEKIDKQGNMSKLWHTDTRKEFIEAVKSLLMITHCDYQIPELKHINEKIDKLKKKIAERKAYWMDQEWKWWNSLSPLQKSQASREGKVVQKGYFNAKLAFDNHFYEEELDIYREICTVINDMTKELNYYGTEGFSA